jgi:hypothetical protein
VFVFGYPQSSGIKTMRIYNLTTKKHGLSNLANSRIKISRLDELNDPFELMGLELKTREARRSFYGFKKKMASKFGLICFSKHWENPVLWSHYGEKHAGICLGFDVPNTQLQKIDYSAERLKIAIDKTGGSIELNEESMKKLLFTKFEHWQYEEEFRVYTSLEEKYKKTGLYFKDFDKNLVLKEVIVGPMCDVTYEDIIDNIGETNNIKIIKARLAFKSYRVIKNENPGKSWHRNA